MFLDAVAVVNLCSEQVLSGMEQSGYIREAKEGNTAVLVIHDKCSIHVDLSIIVNDVGRVLERCRSDVC